VRRKIEDYPRVRQYCPEVLRFSFRMVRRGAVRTDDRRIGYWQAMQPHAGRDESSRSLLGKSNTVRKDVIPAALSDNRQMRSLGMTSGLMQRVQRYDCIRSHRPRGPPDRKPAKNVLQRVCVR